MQCCDRNPHKHGLDRQGFQRWKCPECNRTWSDNPEPLTAGRPTLGDKPQTDAERKRKSRALAKKKAAKGKRKKKEQGR